MITSHMLKEQVFDIYLKGQDNQDKLTQKVGQLTWTNSTIKTNLYNYAAYPSIFKICNIIINFILTVSVR